MLSLWSQVAASQALPSIVFSKAFNILERSDGNSLHHQFQCWAVMSCCRCLEHPYITTKERLQLGGARQAFCCFSSQSAGLEPLALLLFSECEFWIPPPPLTPSLPSPWPLMLCNAVWGLIPDLDCLTVSLGIFSIPCGFKRSCMWITIAVVV